MALVVGSRLGHYDVTALIGEGSMGQVYQATDTKLNRRVALRRRFARVRGLNRIDGEYIRTTPGGVRFVHRVSPLIVQVLE